MPLTSVKAIWLVSLRDWSQPAPVAAFSKENCMKARHTQHGSSVKEDLANEDSTDVLYQC
jgi:hypothetical protein